MSNTSDWRMDLLMTAACARNARNPTTRSTAWRGARARIIVRDSQAEQKTSWWNECGKRETRRVRGTRVGGYEERRRRRRRARRIWTTTRERALVKLASCTLSMLQKVRPWRKDSLLVPSTKWDCHQNVPWELPKYDWKWLLCFIITRILCYVQLKLYWLV